MKRYIFCLSFLSLSLIFLISHFENITNKNLVITDSDSNETIIVPPIQHIDSSIARDSLYLNTNELSINLGDSTRSHWNVYFLSPSMTAEVIISQAEALDTERLGEMKIVCRQDDLDSISRFINVKMEYGDPECLVSAGISDVRDAREAPHIEILDQNRHILATHSFVRNNSSIEPGEKAEIPLYDLYGEDSSGKTVSFFDASVVGYISVEGACARQNERIAIAIRKKCLELNKQRVPQLASSF